MTFPSSSNTVLVTGGAGFIGSHVVDLLVQEGYRVVVVDDLSTGRREHVNPSATFYQIDITDPALTDVFLKERPQAVSHHAAQISIAASLRDPLHDARTNVMGSLNVLEACRAVEVEKVVFASSGGAVYGEPDYLPCDEKHPVRPLAPYSAAKAAVEGYLFTYSQSFGLPSTVLRYSNVYGPRQDPSGEAGVIAIFALAMLEGRQPVIYGSGQQERDFVYVADVATANVLALQHGAGGIYNIGSGQGTSVNRIFSLLRNILSFDQEAQFASPRPGEVFKIHLACGLAGQDLGWCPSVSLEEGLKATADYFLAPNRHEKKPLS
ncbi:MAG: NAD-dependent epimerase/dehydratase family protein [Dehalococcoidia bacterium]